VTVSIPIFINLLTKGLSSGRRRKGEDYLKGEKGPIANVRATRAWSIGNLKNSRKEYRGGGGLYVNLKSEPNRRRTEPVSVWKESASRGICLLIAPEGSPSTAQTADVAGKKVRGQRRKTTPERKEKGKIYLRAAALPSWKKSVRGERELKLIGIGGCRMRGKTHRGRRGGQPGPVFAASLSAKYI